MIDQNALNGVRTIGLVCYYFALDWAIHCDAASYHPKEQIATILIQRVSCFIELLLQTTTNSSLLIEPAKWLSPLFSGWCVILLFFLLQVFQSCLSFLLFFFPLKFLLFLFLK